MKKRTAFFAFAGLALLAGTARAEEAKFDFQKINATIAGILSPMTANDPLVGAIGLAVDADYTSVADDRLKVLLTTTLKQTSWTTKPSEFKAAVAAQASAAGTEDASKVDLDFGVELRTVTEAVPMLRYTAKVLKDMNECTRVARHPEWKAQQFLCDELGKLEQVQSLGALAEQLPGVQQGILALIDEEIAKLQQELAAATTDEQRTRISRQIAVAVSERAFAAGLRVRVTGDAGAVAMVTIEATEPLLWGDSFALKTATVSFTDAEFGVAFSGAVYGITTLKNYRAMKNDLVQMFASLENGGDPAAQEKVKGYAAMYISLIKGYTNQ